MACRQPRPIRTIGAVGGIGFVLAVTIVVGALVGRYFDDRWGTGPWLTLAGTLLGTAVGFLEVLRALRELPEKGSGASHR